MKKLMDLTISNKKYKIVLTGHGQERSEQRKIDQGLIISAILSVGFKKIESYNNKKFDIMITDKQNKFNTVFCVRKNTIYIITVIDKQHCFVKSNTKHITI